MSAAELILGMRHERPALCAGCLFPFQGSVLTYTGAETQIFGGCVSHTLSRWAVAPNSDSAVICLGRILKEWEGSDFPPGGGRTTPVYYQLTGSSVGCIVYSIHLHDCDTC